MSLDAAVAEHQRINFKIFASTIITFCLLVLLSYIFIYIPGVNYLVLSICTILVITTYVKVLADARQELILLYSGHDPMDATAYFNL